MTTPQHEPEPVNTSLGTPASADATLVASAAGCTPLGAPALDMTALPSSTGDKTLLRASAVSAGYGHKSVVNDIDLTVSQGEVLGLIGPNGAGKSTLLRALAHLIKPTRGSVTGRDGVVLAGLTARQRAHRVAFLPQDTAVGLGLPSREVVAMGRYAHRSRWQAGPRDEQVIRESLAATGAQPLAQQLIGKLSGGQRQLVLIAKLLAQESDVMLLDEPVSALDLGYQIRVLQLLRQVANSGRGLVLVLHDLNLAARFCDRIALLHAGRLIETGTPNQVLRSALIDDVYQVRSHVEFDKPVGAMRLTVLESRAQTPNERLNQ